MSVVAVTMMMVSVSLDQISSSGARARANQRSFAASNQRASNQARRAAAQSSLFLAVLFMTAIITAMLSTHAHTAKRTNQHHQHKQ
jgi:hypothetical protein